MNPSEQGRFRYEGLDKVIHEKARLGILTSLLTQAEGLSFNELKHLCSLTDGNLSRHLTILSEAGLITIHKGEHLGRPQTVAMVTAEGRKRFANYLSVLEQVLADALPVTQPSSTAAVPES
ncbi:MAG: transcriptional regulator [Gemmataceae bacterium]|jgi:DNA-binding MarR family transcriptional regulator|nr:transcriptional regulator [Gemmataceae bacterium]